MIPAQITSPVKAENDIIEKVSIETNSVQSNLNDDSQSEANRSFSKEQSGIQDRINEIITKLQSFLYLECMYTKIEIFKLLLHMNSFEIIYKNVDKLFSHLAIGDLFRISKRGYSHCMKIKQKFERETNKIQNDWFSKRESQIYIETLEFLLKLNDALKKVNSEHKSIFEEYSEYLKIDFSDNSCTKYLKLKAISTFSNEKNLWIYQSEFKKIISFFGNYDAKSLSKYDESKITINVDFLNENIDIHPNLKGFSYEFDNKKDDDHESILSVNSII